MCYTDWCTSFPQLIADYKREAGLPLECEALNALDKIALEKQKDQNRGERRTNAISPNKMAVVHHNRRLILFLLYVLVCCFALMINEREFTPWG